MMEPVSNVGDEQANVLRHRGLVEYVLRTRPLYTAGDIDEDRQEGNIGLLKALRAWNPAGGASFSLFATSCIWHEIQKGRNIRYGINYRRAVYGQGFYESPVSIDASQDDHIAIVDTLEADKLVGEDTSRRDEMIDWLAALLTEHERAAVFMPISAAVEQLGVTKAAIHKRRVRAYARLRNLVTD